MRPRFSRLVGGLHIGTDFFARQRLQIESPNTPRGIVDHVAELANPSVDVTRIHPAIVVFFEDTASLELHIESRWRGPFALAWRIARPLFSWVGQFVLPRVQARIATRVFALDRAQDGRDDARAVVRTYAATNDPMQVVAYATVERAGSRFMSAAFPWPGGHLAGILRLEAIGEDAEGHLAVALSSARRDGDIAGVWYVTPAFGVPLPLREKLQLWAAGMACAPPDLDRDRVAAATIVGRHEQYFLGLHVVTHDYWFVPKR